jgi:transcriptional antiterminator RfaH
VVRRWYVARTRPRVESLACSELVRDGLETFLPRINSPLPEGGFTNDILFPGYLFIHCDPETDGWPIFRNEHRMLGWLGFDGVVPALPDEDVNKLMDSINEINDTGGLWRRYQVGEMVNVKSNTVSGLAKVLEVSKSPRSRVKVLMEFMGQLVPAQVPWESIEPLGLSQENENGPDKAPRRTRGRGRWVSGFGPSSTVAV